MNFKRLYKPPIPRQREEIIEIKKDDIEYKDYVRNSRPCGFRPNPIFSLDDLPIPKPKIDNFNDLNTEVSEKHGVEFPIELGKGIDKYIKMVDNYKNSKNPHISIEKAIHRELKKKKKKKMNMCKIINKKNTLYF